MVVIDEVPEEVPLNGVADEMGSDQHRTKTTPWEDCHVPGCPRRWSRRYRQAVAPAASVWTMSASPATTAALAVSTPSSQPSPRWARR